MFLGLIQILFYFRYSSNFPIFHFFSFRHTKQLCGRGVVWPVAVEGCYSELSGQCRGVAEREGVTALGDPLLLLCMLK